MKMKIMLFFTIISIFGFTEADKPIIKQPIDSTFSTNVSRTELKSYANIVNPYLLELLDQPRIELGILIQKVSNGLMIIDILKGSPCAKAGFVIGDVITKFNNRMLIEPSDLQESIKIAASGSKNKLSYFTSGQLLESEMMVIVQKLSNGTINLKIISNKTTKAENKASLSNVAIEDYLSVLRNSNKWISGKAVDSIGTMTFTDNAGNTTVTSLSGGMDGKKLNEIQKVNQKEIDDYLKKMKVSNAAAEKYFADGKIPANIPINLTNAATVKDALNQLATAGIKVDEAKVQKYLLQNGNKGNFGDIQLNQIVPKEVLALYGNTDGPVNKKARVSRLSKLNNPNSDAIIKQLESLNNAVDGQKKGTKKNDGVADFSYTKSGGIGSNGDSTVSKDFIPAYMVKQKKQLLDANGEGKPVFIPSVKPAEKKAGEQFVSKEFIPTNTEANNTKKSNGNNLNEVLPITQKDASKLNEKNGDQPVFIPSPKKIDKESSEVDNLIRQMRKVADANLKQMQSNRSKEGKVDQNTAIDQNAGKQKKNPQDKPTNKEIISPIAKPSDKKTNEGKTVDLIPKNDSVKSNDNTNVQPNDQLVNNKSSLNIDNLTIKKGNTTLPEKKITKADSIVNGKPVFIPTLLPTAKKTDDKFITKDFIPTQVVVKGNAKIDSNNASLVKSNPEKVTVKLDEKNGNKPVFIPSTKTADKQSDEVNRLMNEMKRVANASLLLKKGNNSADSVDLTGQVSKKLAADGKVTQEKATKTSNNTSIDSIRVAKANVNKLNKFTLGKIDSLLPASREFPVIPHFKLDSIQDGYIYFIANYKLVQHPILPEQGNRFWKWLDIFIR